MKTAIDCKCPNCGANIKFNPETQKMDCIYCGNSYSVKDFEKKYQSKKAEKSSEKVNIDEYTCPGCGAVVITDENTVATHCVYCGNTAILKNILQEEFKPDKIIPFKTKKEEAIQEFKENIKKRRFSPDDFSNEDNIEKIQGVYIPFWLYDSIIEGEISAIAKRIRSWTSGNYVYTETERYRCYRKGNIEVRDLPVDGSSKFPDDIMDSIEPYNYKEFVEFNKSYLSGFLAEKYDLNSEEVYNRAKLRMENTAINELESTIRGYNNINIENKSINVSNGAVEYALLPVWMLNIKYRDKMYTFAMNGQTRKVVGNVPISIKKLIRKSLLKFIKYFGISFGVISLIMLISKIGGVL